MTDTRPSIAERRARFRQLHQSGCFLIPNPFDVGSARWLQSLGFHALASTSSGAAFSHGRHDGGMTLDEVLTHLRSLVDARQSAGTIDLGPWTIDHQPSDRLSLRFVPV